MNILLVYPRFPETFWSFTYALGFIGKKAAFPPLGLITVASLLPAHWPKRLVDLNVEGLADKDLAWADMAFISGMAVQRSSAKAVIASCRAANLPVVAGGPLFTAEPDQFGDVDHLVLDEAEVTLPAFLSDWQDDHPQKIYRAPDFCDIGDTPAPAWDLVDTRRYAAMNIQFSRGCPFNCEFCNVTELFGHRPRMKTPVQVIAELDRIYATGWRSSIFFVDDNFIGNKGYLKTYLLPALIEWRRNKTGCVFLTEASINIADDTDLMDMMVKAGFDSVFIGIESPDEDSLTECRKTHNTKRDLLRDVKNIHRSGLQVMGGFIVGFDNDSPSIFQRQIDFIQKSGIVTAMVGLLQAPPGTRLFKRLQQERRIANIFNGDNVDGTTNIVPRMGIGRLIEGYQSIMRQLYSPKGYYQRVRTLLKELKAPEITQPLSLQRFLSFFRAAFWIGFLGKERWQYWQLMIWTLIRKRRMMPVAITLSIYGYHYRKICELYILNRPEEKSDLPIPF